MKIKFYSIILFGLLFFTAIGKSVSAQSTTQDFSSVRVDDLSDEQVKQLLQQANAWDLSDNQLIQLAQGKGMSAPEAQKLQVRISALRKKGAGANTSNYSDTSQLRRKLNYQADTDTAGRAPAKKDIFGDLLPSVFGASIFRNGELTFAPNLNLATPANYVVGPSDQLNVNVFGNSVANWKLEVSPEGNINIPGVGLLNVAGRSIEQATALIKAKLAASNYAVGHGTTVQVSLGNIRSIKVILVGEVTKPGSYTLPSLATAFNALYAAGGPNNRGSFRQIEIIRNNKIIRKLDIYDFLTKGEQKDNINLQDQDIIRIPTYRTRVELAGEVKDPALFEVLPGETLADVIRFAGGFTDFAYTTRIKILQISDQQRRVTDLLENDFKNYIPLRGDKYIVEPITDRFENRVTIEGAVFRPGIYELEKGLTLSSLIEKAAGLKEDAFTSRGTLIRLKADNTIEQVSFNLKDILNKTSPDILLQREDKIAISSIFDLRDQYRVLIKGEVRLPGEFTYADRMKVADLIVKAGGFTEGASNKRIEVSRRLFTGDPNMATSAVAQVYAVNVSDDLRPGDGDFMLQPFDMVSVYSLPGYEKQKTVKVEGEVLYPGYYTIQKKNEKISDIIQRAGGLTTSADIEGSSLKRDNIAVLGVDRTKMDTVALLRERASRFNKLNRSLRDSTNNLADTTQLRNNYVGIDLKKIMEKPGILQDLILENGDVLRVPKQQQIVKVNGEVLYPSAVVYEGGKSYKEYVLNAGGFSPKALRRSAYIVYANGTVKGTKKFLFFNVHPDVKPGSELYVPTKPEPKTNTGQQLLGYTTGFASLAAIIFGIVSLRK